ncbi:hypothetical protein LINGRAHAP2_LOCUS29353 [Linum grandiflorum]
MYSFNPQEMNGNEIVHLEIGFKLIHRLIQSLENGIEGFGKIYLCVDL